MKNFPKRVSEEKSKKCEPFFNTSLLFYNFIVSKLYNIVWDLENTKTLKIDKKRKKDEKSFFSSKKWDEMQSQDYKRRTE